MRREVRLDIVYPHPPERIWKALTDRKALEKWLMPNDFLPCLGHRFHFIKEGNGTEEGPGKRKREVVECEVIELDAPRRLAYTWRSDPETPPELVSWTLEPVEAGTRLRLEHIALEDAAAPFTAHLDPQWKKRVQSRLAAYLGRKCGCRVSRIGCRKRADVSRFRLETRNEIIHA
jgi:uncharacterized protein YndB with AHSA1/START domain